MSNLKACIGAQMKLAKQDQKQVPTEVVINGVRAINNKGAQWRRIRDMAEDGEVMPAFERLKQWLETAPNARINATPKANTPKAPTVAKAIMPKAPTVAEAIMPKAPTIMPKAPTMNATSFDMQGFVSAMASQVVQQMQPQMLALTNGGDGDSLNAVRDLAVEAYMTKYKHDVRAAAAEKYVQEQIYEPGTSVVKPAFLKLCAKLYTADHEAEVAEDAAKRYMRKMKGDEEFNEQAIDAFIKEKQDDQEFKTAVNDQYINDNDVHDDAIKQYIQDEKDNDDFKVDVMNTWLSEHGDEQELKKTYREENKETLMSEAIDKLIEEALESDDDLRTDEGQKIRDAAIKRIKERKKARS
jgi:hypothetical protein